MSDSNDFDDIDAINRRLDPTPNRETPIERMAETAVAVAEVVADQEMKKVAEVVAQRRTRRLTMVLVAMLALSLLLHALTLSRLFATRATIKNEITRLAQAVQGAKDEKLRYDFPIDQELPINVKVPINESVVIPINTSVRIKEDFRIPIDTGFGKLELPVPVDVNIPISTTVPITFNQEIAISTTFPLKLTVPIQLDMSSTQLSGYLDRIHDALLQLRDEF